MKKLLLIENLKVQIKDKLILKGINLEIDKGQVVALMGPNGSGKTSLAYTLMGHPKYQVISGKLSFLGQALESQSVEQRAKSGIFLAFQHPIAIEGVSLKEFLYQAYNAIYACTDKKLDIKGFIELLSQKVNMLKIDPSFIERSVNVGFSGGERKKFEILQMSVLQPKLVILDEIDSGLDIDSLKVVCDGVNYIRKDNPEMSVLVITHYPRILKYLIPDSVNVIQDGKIIRSGDKSLALELEVTGYE